MNDIITIQNVRGYIDSQNMGWINAEDAARGLGFVEVKKDRVATSGDEKMTLDLTEGRSGQYGGYQIDESENEVTSV